MTTSPQLVPGDEAGTTESESTGAGKAPPTTRFERWFLAAGLTVLAGLVIGVRHGVFTPDTRPDVYEQPGRFVAESLRAWVRGPLGLGQSNFNAGAVPVGAVIWFIRTLGAPAWLAVRLWRLLLLIVAAWGIRRYLGVLLGSALTPTARMVATVFWVANPYVIVAGNTTPILLPYALLPWTMAAFLQAGRRGGWRWPAVFGLAFFVQGGLNAGVVSFFQLAAIPAHMIHLRYGEGVRWRQLVTALVRCGIFSVLVSLYWLAPSFLASGSGASIASSTENPADVARTSSYAEVARGLGHWPLYGSSGARLFLGGYTVYLTNRLVLAATYVFTAAIAFFLHRTRHRARLLAGVLLATALPIMVGMFPGTDPAPAGRLLERVFHAVPATMAFRTTNKVGSVAVLGTVIALTLGVAALQRRVSVMRLRRRFALLVPAFAVLLLGAAPLWNGSLYPLDYEVPDRWREATAALDAEGDGNVLVVPGGTGGNYRWGVRSPDDLFPSHLERPVVSRNTVVGAGDPAGNLLTWFDTELQLGSLPGDGVSTMARYLGADRVVNRNDVLAEETEGANPAMISARLADDDGLHLLRTHGATGVDTVPEASGEPTDEEREAFPAEAALDPIEIFEVDDPLPDVNLADVRDLLLIDGDGAALAPLVEAGRLEGEPPIRYVGDLDVDDLAEVLGDGARIVLTDTNQRRAWDINRLTDASSAVLRADEPLDSGSGPSVTLWPDVPDLQTVAEHGPAIRSVDTDFETFGIRPWGKPLAAIDGDRSTRFRTGGIISPRGGSIEIEFEEPTIVTSLLIEMVRTEPARVTEFDVETDGQQLSVPMPAAGGARAVPILPEETRRIRLTVADMTDGLNQIAIAEIVVNNGEVHAVDGLRIPRGIPALLDRADEERRAELEAALDSTPIDLVFSRLRGRPDRGEDDEEVTLNRVFEMPVTRELRFEAILDRTGVDRDALDEARRGEAGCRQVGLLDGVPLHARIVDLEHDAAPGSVAVEGCFPVTVEAGTHDLRSDPAWRFDRISLRDDDAEAVSERGSVTVLERHPTEMRIRVPEGDGPRYLRTGIGFDPRWRLEIDGRDQGPPITLDGFAAAWRIGPEAVDVRIHLPSQGAVGFAFLLTGLGLTVTTGVAVLPGIPTTTRRRRDGEVDHGTSDTTGDGDGGNRP